MAARALQVFEHDLVQRTCMHGPLASRAFIYFFPPQRGHMAPAADTGDTHAMDRQALCLSQHACALPLLLQLVIE